MKDNTLYVMTQSTEKIRIAKAVFSEFGIKFKFHKTMHPEIQADSGIAIARHAAIKEAEELGRPVVREDHSFYVNAITIPGPYSSYMQRKIPVSKMLKIMGLFKDKSAYYELCAVYADPEGNVKEYSFKVRVVFVDKPKGKGSIGWDRITCFKGTTKTFAEYTEKERRTKGWIEKWDKNFVTIAKDIQSGKINQ